MTNEYIPDVVKVTFSPPEIDPRGGLGKRGTAVVTMRDHVMSDFFADPYFRDRGYDTSRGTYWGKWLARNKFAEGNKVVVRSGYKTDPLDYTNFQDHTYFIEKLSGPDHDRMVTMELIDILKFANDNRAQCPVPNSAVLAADISSGALSLTLSPAGVGSEFAASGTVAVGTEFMTFTRSGDVLTIVRSTDGTSPATHSAGDAVQQCARFSGRVDAIIYDLLTNFAEIDPAFINYTAWQTEAGDWLSSCVFTNVLISQPEGVNTLLTELCEQCLITMWWDEVSKLIGFRAIRPPIDLTVTDLDYDDDVVQGSIYTETDPEDRLSAVAVHFNMRDRFETELKASNYGAHTVQLDTDAESETLGYGSRRIRTFFSRWLGLTNASVATALAGRLLSRFRNPPKRATVEVDAYNSTIKIADMVRLTVREVQDETGLPLTMLMQVLKVEEVENGHKYKLTLIDSGLNGRYGLIAPNGFGNYPAETTAHKDRYAFICYNTGLFLDGTPAYRII
jgi:hypothetical protein